MSKDSKVSLILYTDHEIPKYFEVKKSVIKFLFYVLPFVTVASLIAVILGGLSIKHIRVLAARKEPAIIQELRDENVLLDTRVQELMGMNREFETKLSQTHVDSEGLSATLGLFKLTAGMQDLSANPIIGIEDVTLKPLENEIHLAFNLLNLAPETNRQVGYIFAMLISGSSISFYPETAFSDDDPLVSYTKGEYFATARFRPVEAVFKGNFSKRGMVKILLFSRTGDLIAKKTQTYAF